MRPYLDYFSVNLPSKFYNASMDRAIYRIIDANFNRGREAARVVEEFCRFALDCAPLAGRAKQLRHELSSQMAMLDGGQLTASRDTVGDIGCGLEVQGQLKRANLQDCLSAACKRLTEALRVLAETSQTIDADIAKRFEQLRYTCYTLEKDIINLAIPAEKFKSVRLYVILSEQRSDDIISLSKDCIAGGADCLQLRAKNISDMQYLAVAKELVRICKDSGVISIINDRVDIAVACDADGVHLGQNDLSIAEASKMQLKPLIFGTSTHSMPELQQALTEQPHYVGLGSIFPSNTKEDVEVVGVDYITDAAKMLAGTSVRSVAIGGITVENMDKVLTAGAEAVAISSAVTKADDPKAMCRAFKDKILAHN